MPTITKPKRVDGQVTGLAGELFVAAELLKLGYENAWGIFDEKVPY